MYRDQIRIAVVQHPPVFMNLKASIEAAEIFIKDAVSNEADLIIFPETWLPGYPVWIDYAPEAGIWDHPPAKKIYRLLYNQSVQNGDGTLEQFSKKAAAKKIDIVLGAHERDGNTLYNTMYFFTRDGEVNKHRKLMPTYTERLIWGMGDGSTLHTSDTEYGTVGGLICWEHWMPFARAVMHNKNETIHVAQWPYVKELHQLCSRHYAFEGQCFVIASGSTLTKGDMLEGLQSLPLSEEQELSLELIESIPVEYDDYVLKGGSAVIGPHAEYLVDPVHNSKETIYEDIDLSVRAEGNMYLDTDGHYSRPDIFTLNVDTSAKKNIHFSEDD